MYAFNDLCWFSYIHFKEMVPQKYKLLFAHPHVVHEHVTHPHDNCLWLNLLFTEEIKILWRMFQQSCPRNESHRGQKTFLYLVYIVLKNAYSLRMGSYSFRMGMDMWLWALKTRTRGSTILWWTRGQTWLKRRKSLQFCSLPLSWSSGGVWPPSLLFSF